MSKIFNDVGVCFPEDHFMADISEKIDAIYKMVEKGNYFIINRPRQYGKTTVLFTLTDKLLASDEYIPFKISFEGISDRNFLDETLFAPGFVRLLANSIRSFDPNRAAELRAKMPMLTNLDDLSDFITDVIEKTGKKVVLLIDEVDKSSNNQLFISFLGMLRDKYLGRKGTATSSLSITLLHSGIRGSGRGSDSNPLITSMTCDSGRKPRRNPRTAGSTLF